MNKARTYLIVILLLCSVSMRGQHRKLQNQPYADQRIFHLGFTIGLNTQDLILTNSGYVNENGEVWFSEIPRYSPGFAIGLISDLHINRFMNMRVIPTIYLGEKQFIFKEQTSGEEYSTTIRNNYLSIPLYFKFSSERTNNYRPYAIIGGYGSVELASKKNQAVLLKPYDFGLELGIGCDFYLPMFKLAPELKFSFGLVDILETYRNDLKNEELFKYANSLSNARQRMITLSFNFE